MQCDKKECCQLTQPPATKAETGKDRAATGTFNMDQEVQRIWTQKPGAGVQELFQELFLLYPDNQHITKKRVKAAKAAVRYRRILPDAPDAPDAPNVVFDKQDFVQEQLELRSGYQSCKRWESADRITEGLQAMGIELDNRYKTWRRGKPPERQPPLDDTTTTGVACTMCGRRFGSRNLVFAHLRDPASGCGTSLWASGQTLAEPPSVVHKKEIKSKPRRCKTGATARHAPAASCLWVGDLPLSWTRMTGGSYKQLRALLFAHSPLGVSQPWIKTVVRKAYRRKCHDAGDETPYLGYAIVVYRDAAEATRVQKQLKGIRVTVENVYTGSTASARRKLDLQSFSLAVRHVENDFTEAAAHTWRQPGTGNDSRLPSSGLDPPLPEQLRPLEASELRRRVERLQMQPLRQQQSEAADSEHCPNGPGSPVAVNDDDHESALAHAAALYEAMGPRREVGHAGRLIPVALQQRLLTLLETLRWSAQNQRPGLSAERYLVLTTSSNDPAYRDLRQACRELMQWADPSYFYSGIAVTKNFMASPHIDDRDQSFQYATALGKFNGGGELCVEGLDDNNSDFVNVVKTHNRIARVDGRHVHWVRTWTGGDRYSLIFYDTSDRRPTHLIGCGVDLSYLSCSPE